MTKLLQVCSLSILLVLLTGSLAVQVQAQDDPVPVIDEAQELFEQGLDAFRQGRYEIAEAYFVRAYDDFPLHRRTTASVLMAGKALYRLGDYGRAIDVLNILERQYPTTNYLDEAQRVKEFARVQMQRGDAEAEVFNLGVILPMQDDDVALAQALFNGIHTAVAQANEERLQPVRIHFRDSENDPDVARRMVRDLGDAGVDAIIGPLFSREAQAAAAAAQSEGIVMLVPLATDKSVSDGRDFVFQANPTIEMRGRIMARYARDELGIGSFGVVSQGDNEISQIMAEGFQREIVEEGGDLRFFHQLQSQRGWSQLTSEVGEEYFLDVEGLYLPIAGGNAPQSIRNALNSLDGVDTPAQILGNAEWHDRNVRQQASRYVATYTNDFYVDANQEEVQQFVARYSDRFQETPDQLTFTGRRLVYAGYDITNYLLNGRDRAAGGGLRDALYSSDVFNGLGTRIRFEESNINEAMFFHRYRNNRIELMQ